VKRQTDDLETQIANRKRELITEIVEHKKNSSRYGAAEAIDKIKHHLSELSQIMNASECSTLTAGARLRLVQWMAR
jgi:malate/lactate dehydrogenase